jgi:hypothetical protein
MHTASAYESQGRLPRYGGPGQPPSPYASERRSALPAVPLLDARDTHVIFVASMAAPPPPSAVRAWCSRLCVR